MVPGNGDRDGIPLFGIHFIDFGTPASGVAALARRQQQLILFHGDQVFIDSRNTQIKLAGQFLAGHAAVCLQSLENTNTVIFLNVVTCNGIELLCHNVSFCMTRNILAYLTRHAGCLSSFLRASAVRRSLQNRLSGFPKRKVWEFCQPGLVNLLKVIV